MTDGGATPPKYNSAVVEQVILEEAVELHPRLLTVNELSLRIVGDPGDARETSTATRAIRDLRQVGLFSYNDNAQIVEPTQAALRAVALLS